MKALNRIFIAAIAATAMTACNNELSEQIASNQGGDVKFTMGIEGTSASRVAMEDGSYQASFESTNAVGIFVKEVDSYSNLEYTYNGNAWTGATVNVPADGVYTYYAYYPYAASATSTAIAAEVSADQETGGYLANDYLMANYLTATPGQANVDLQFTHALSLVEVTLSGPNAAEDAVVALSNMTTDATINLEASTVTPGQTKGNVTMDNLTTAMKYRAIVPEQTVTKGTALMTIASKGRTYKVSYKASDVKFERGKYISLNVELGSSSSAEDYTVTITSQGITDWGASTETPGDASVSVAELSIPLPTDGQVLETIASNWSSSTTDNQIGADKAEGWYKRSNSSIAGLTVVGYDEAEQALTIKRTTEGKGAWNNDNVTFHSCTPLELAKYTLSFDVKCVNNDENAISVSGVVGVAISSSGDNRLFKICDNSWADNKRTVTTFTLTSPEEVETSETEWSSGAKTVNFNFGQISEYGSSSPNTTDDKKEPYFPNYPEGFYTDAADENVNSGVNIMFYNYKSGANTTLYIRNIKLTKVEE